MLCPKLKSAQGQAENVEYSNYIVRGRYSSVMHVVKAEVDGKRVTIENSSPIFVNNGDPIYIVGTQKDGVLYGQAYAQINLGCCQYTPNFLSLILWILAIGMAYCTLNTNTQDMMWLAAGISSLIVASIFWYSKTVESRCRKNVKRFVSEQKRLTLWPKGIPSNCKKIDRWRVSLQGEVKAIRLSVPLDIDISYISLASRSWIFYINGVACKMDYDHTDAKHLASGSQVCAEGVFYDGVFIAHKITEKKP